MLKDMRRVASRVMRVLSVDTEDVHSERTDDLFKDNSFEFDSSRQRKEDLFEHSCPVLSEQLRTKLENDWISGTLNNFLDTRAMGSILYGTTLGLVKNSVLLSFANGAVGLLLGLRSLILWLLFAYLLWRLIIQPLLSFFWWLFWLGLICVGLIKLVAFLLQDFGPSVGQTGTLNELKYLSTHINHQVDLMLKRIFDETWNLVWSCLSSVETEDGTSANDRFRTFQTEL